MRFSWKLHLLKVAITVDVCLHSFGHGEYFTSVAQLELLVDYQSEFAKLLKNHIYISTGYIEEFKPFAEFEALSNHCENTRNCSVTSLDVLNNFVRLSEKLAKSKQFIDEMTRERKKLLEFLNEVKERLPDSNDVDGAANAILRLQETYKLDATSFINMTTIETHRNRSIMQRKDFYHLGRTAYLNDKMELTSQWMKLTLDSVGNTDDDDYDDKYSLGRTKNKINYELDARDHLVFSEYNNGRYKSALNYIKEILIRDPNNTNALNNYDIVENKLLESNNQDEVNAENKFYIEDAYGELCRGEKRMSVSKMAEDSKLVCGYSREDPRLKIRPIKYEMISMKPEIYVFYQMTSEYEMKVLKRLAYPHLTRATVSDPESSVVQVASYRISKSGWLSDEDHEVVRTISHRIEAVSGLSLKTAEDLQIANYGIGGHYEPHFDWSYNYKSSEMGRYGQGNRIATALLYLNDVASGGATVFMERNITIFPKKGSMAFWFNLQRNGTGNIDTIHAACPVLIGNKWVANKWFHERGQEYIRPCSLKRTQ